MPLLPALVVIIGACLIAGAVQAGKPLLKAWLGASTVRPWTLRLAAQALAQVLAAVVWLPGVAAGLLPDAPRSWVIVGAVVCAALSESAYQWAWSLVPRVMELLEGRILGWVGGSSG